MIIKYDLYRAKNGEIFNREAIKWNLEKDEDILDLDTRLQFVLTKHISDLDEIKKFGSAYVGKMDIVSIQITDEDYTCELDEQHFMDYIKEILPNLNVLWCKTTNISSKS